MLFLKRLQERAPAFKGEITAFLVLLFVLMLSLIGALIESASIHMEKSCKRVRTMMALESTFAEYHRELLEQYDIFARNGNPEEVIKSRLSYYGAGGMEHQIEKKELLTDDFGQPYYEAAIIYMQDWLGLKDFSFGPEYIFSAPAKIEKEELNNANDLQNFLEQENATLPEEDNPIAAVQNLKKTSLLGLLATDSSELSNRRIEVSDLASTRQLEKGNYHCGINSGASDKAFFVAYLAEHFSNVTKYDNTHTLFYELEYLLGGQFSDRENLEVVCKKLVGMRMAGNYAYLLTDSTCQAEAEAMAGTLCTLIALPEITAIVKQGILLAWAYGESIVDVRQLLKGKKVPLVKTKATWQLQLKNLTSLGTSQEVYEEKQGSQGFGYEDYLKGLLLLEKKETLCMRSLDLMEKNLQIKADQCMTRVEVRSKADLRRGVQETFLTTFGYQ